MTTILAAAGWALAAFLCGYMLGRARDRPRRKNAKSGATEARDKAMKEWRNFLTYDGTEQSGPVE